MYMFIGREQELSFLEEKYKSKKGELVVLYGRRRVGKTETLKEFCKDKSNVFYSCKEVSDRQQLISFSAKLLKEDIPASKYINEFADWEEAFKAVVDLPYGKEKKLLIIDEFPYMCKGNSSIMSILQNLWDNVLKNENVMIIVCGSSMSFIEKELLAEKNPLYGRATGIYKMEAMSFYDAIKFFPNYSERDKVLVYAILGGIPHYLNQFSPDLSLEENIKKNILSKGSVLYSEVEFMLKQELRETQLYNSIIEAIAYGNSKLNDISNKSYINNASKVSVYLKNLIELEIIKREFSVDVKDKEKVNNSRGIYKITDNYFRFWYAFVFNNISELESGDVDGVYEYVIKPSLNDFAAQTFEDICLEYMRAKQRKNELPFRYNKIGRWWGKLTRINDGKKETVETEIDILATTQKSNKCIIGECKFKNKAFSYKEYMDTVSKNYADSEKSELYYFLFSANGFDKKIESEALNNNKIILVDIKEICKG